MMVWDANAITMASEISVILSIRLKSDPVARDGGEGRRERNDLILFGTNAQS